MVAADANWSECEWVWSSDIARPIATARILSQRANGDSVETTIEYTILGRARAGDSGARFVREIVIDTVHIRVSVDGRRSGRVQCGEYNLNHPGITVFLRDWMPSLDSTSREEWETALSAVLH